MTKHLRIENPDLQKHVDDLTRSIALALRHCSENHQQLDQQQYTELTDIARGVNQLTRATLYIAEAITANLTAGRNVNITLRVFQPNKAVPQRQKQQDAPPAFRRAFFEDDPAPPPTKRNASKRPKRNRAVEP